MQILTLEIKLDAPWVQSLKKKRMIVKSLKSKLANRFQVSVAEIEAQDIHKTIVIGVAAIVESNKKADQMEEAILEFIEMNTEAVILEYISEIR